jgi:hypothetical protein
MEKTELKAASTETEWPLQQRLPDEELKGLGVLMEQMMRRWPAQNLEDSIDAFMTDMEQLAIRCGLRRVQEAVAALRIAPEQKFFPRPDEVAKEIEVQRSKLHAAASQRQTQEYLQKLESWKRRREAERASGAINPPEVPDGAD